MNAQMNDENSLKNIGKSAYQSIVDMVAALECDYDRLEELKEERDGWEPPDVSDIVDPAVQPKPALTWEEHDPSGAEELAELIEAAGDCDSRDTAQERIQDDPLCIEVRSGWVAVGGDLDAEEFMILLTTGGPAVRIMGELDEYKQPRRAWLEVQDWFQPWTRYFDADMDVLLTYCQQFYFGE